MNKKAIRDYINLVKACLFSILYVPHYICVLSLGGGGQKFTLLRS